MLMYGKYMLFNDTLFDFDDKLDKMNKITLDDVMESARLTFASGRKAVGAVGNREKPFSL